MTLRLSGVSKRAGQYSRDHSGDGHSGAPAQSQSHQEHGRRSVLLIILPSAHRLISAGFDPMQQDHHYLLMCLLMTASDLSDQSKDFYNSKAIAVRLSDRLEGTGC
jgi:hypothetical protein